MKLQDQLKEMAAVAEAHYNALPIYAAIPYEAELRQERAVRMATNHLIPLAVLGMLFNEPELMSEPIGDYAGHHRTYNTVFELALTVVQKRVNELLDRKLHPEKYPATPAA